MKDIQVSITEQKRLLNQLLQCAKYSKNPHDLLKYVPSLKISIQTAEINSKIKRNSVKQLELFPSRKQREIIQMEAQNRRQQQQADQQQHPGLWVFPQRPGPKIHLTRAKSDHCQ